MPTLEIKKWNGGLSKGSKEGLRGSFRFGKALNIHEDTDLLKVNPKSTKESGSTITDLPMFGVNTIINANKYFLGDTGKLYKRTSSAVYSVLQTLAGANAEGMGFFAGTNLIYGSSGDTQFTIDPDDDAVNPSYRNLNVAEYHPSEQFLDKIFTGNGRELISTNASGTDLDSTTIGGGITIDYNYSIRTLKNLGSWLLLGATSDNSSDARYFLWDGFSGDYNFARTINEDGINAVVIGDNGTILISAGKKGNIYQLINTDQPLVKMDGFPRIESNKTIEVFPQAVANYQGFPSFGLSAGTSVTAERGIYSWASKDKDNPKVLNFDFPISTTTTTGITTQVGMLLSINATDMLVGWRDDATYGIDIIDGSGVQPTAVYESLIHDGGDSTKIKYYQNFQIKLASNLKTGEVVTLSYKANRASTWTDIGTMDFSVDGAKSFKFFKPDIRAYELEVKLTITNTNNTAPDIDSLLVVFDEEEIQ